MFAVFIIFFLGEQPGFRGVLRIYFFTHLCIHCGYDALAAANYVVFVHISVYTYKFIYLLRCIVVARIVNSKSLAHSRLAVHIKFDCSGPPPPLDSAAARLVDPPGDRAVCIKSNYDVRY